jgi:nucleotide-binding universal stress UspA family protein
VERRQHRTKVVVGWTGTEQGADALHLAVELARLTAGRLTVACVIEPGVVPPELVRDRQAWAERFEQLTAAARHELSDVSFSVREAIDDAAEGLRSIALEEDADLLVLGSTHRGTLGSVFPGTTAEHLLSDPPCAVAVAPLGYAERQHVELGLLGVGYDGTSSSRAALELAEKLAARADDELRIVSVAPDYATTELPLGPLEPLRAETEGRVERALESVPEGVSAEGVLASGDPAAVLAEQGVELDLLVIGTRSRGFLKRALMGSVSADVIHNAPCPVVVVPES